MDFKTSLDKYLTPPSESQFEDYLEHVYNNVTFWLPNYDLDFYDQWYEFPIRLTDKDMHYKEAAKIMDRYYSIYWERFYRTKTIWYELKRDYHSNDKKRHLIADFIMNYAPINYPFEQLLITKNIVDVSEKANTYSIDILNRLRKITKTDAIGIHVVKYLSQYKCRLRHKS